MKAYAIFDGGGVKGAALAGYLATAQDQGIEFIGYGGTSAGSMVALFAAVGYTGQEQEQILVNELDFRSLLDDGGKQLDQAQEKMKQLALEFRNGWRWDLRHLRAACRVPGLLQLLGGSLGLYAGEKLKSFLLERIQQKRPQLKGHADITFEHLASAGCLPLKVVASDITGRKPAVFSRHQTDYGSSVTDAIRASTSYPLAFQPVLRNGRRLVDGGLASNLPAFLFDEEYRQTRVPAFAFDLIAAPGDAPATYQAVHFFGDLLATSLEASDELLCRVLRGVHYVPVPTPTGIDTLDFGLTKPDRQRLFDAGYQATSYSSNSGPSTAIRRT